MRAVLRDGPVPDPVAHLQALVRLATISRLDPADTDWGPFDALIALLPELYPATDEGWTHPPFAAEIVGVGDEQLVWGRGTLDDKDSLTCILEGVEAQVLAGHRPEADIYLSFGHDEQTEGSGARTIVELLESRGIRPFLVIDEGGAVVEDIFPGITGPIAVVGVSEKGTLSLTLTVEQQGGHASTPPWLSATARLSTPALVLHEPLDHETAAPRAVRPTRAGDECDDPHHAGRDDAAGGPGGKRARRTSGGDREHQGGHRFVRGGCRGARAAVHQRSAGSPRYPPPERTLSGLSEQRGHLAAPEIGHRADLSRHDRHALRDDGSKRQSLLRPDQRLRYFARISDFVYRFGPFEMSTDERGTLHAIDERIHVSTLLRGVGFYTWLVGRL